MSPGPVPRSPAGSDTAGSDSAAPYTGGTLDANPLARRLAHALDDLGVKAESVAPALVVAFSGGLDSCVLLHLLRFGLRVESRVVAAHFDHGMRSGSAADAAWARGVCAAWGVECVSERAGVAPTAEAEARDARYAFLERVRTTYAPALVLTAHHADDQAETVLFRIFRGTGIDGLRGMPATREPGIARPLLGFWREELEAYAAAVGLRWREDPTNEQLGYARNVLRHEILPAAEAGVSGGARRALVRLAGLAEREEEAWAEVLPEVLAELDASFAPGGLPGLSLDRDATAALGPALRGRVLRWAASLCGGTLDETATARAVDFASSAVSGARVELGQGLELRRELDRLEVTGPVAPPPDRALVIDAAGAGEGRALLGGRSVAVRWRVGGPESRIETGAAGGDAAGGPEASFRISGLTFPLTVRGRRPGDRITLPGGTSKLKKVLLSARIPLRARTTVPVLVDGDGRVLWVPGVARSTAVRESEGATEEEMLTIRIEA